MLILTRKSDEAIRIGEDIKVTVIAVKGNQVRLGIESPDSVRIHREEIYLKVAGENRLASDLSLDEFQKLKRSV
jgi:carbon storage regulator